MGKHPKIELQRETASGKDNTKRMSLIVTKGSLNWTYPPFILATTAAAMGLEVSMFFTFYGLTLLKKKLDLKIPPLGNPAMEMRSRPTSG